MMSCASCAVGFLGIAFLLVFSRVSFRAKPFSKARCRLEEVAGSPEKWLSQHSNGEATTSKRMSTYETAAGCGTFSLGRSYSHSLFGHAITGPDFRYFSTRYSLPQVGHFSGMGLLAEVNLHFG